MSHDRQKEWTVTRNEMPKRGIQDLRDQVIGELNITDPKFNGYGNLIENVLTVLQKAERIQWEPPRVEMFLVMSPAQLRAAADQLDAYQLLSRSGHDMEFGSMIRIDGHPVGHFTFTRLAPLLVIGNEDSVLPWMTSAQLTQRYARDEPDFEEST